MVSLFGGYAFARFDFPGSELLFLVTLAILMVPYATLLIPLYVLLNALGLQNSLVGLSLVLSMYQLPFAMFMMRISFEAVPRELEDAALVDGCGSVRRAAQDPPAGGRARVSSRSGCSPSWPPGTTSSRRSSSSAIRARRHCRSPSQRCASRPWAPSTTAPRRQAWS